jgi:hypothetical protein
MILGRRFSDRRRQRQRFGYFYSWDDVNAVHPPDDALTADEATHIAEKFAKLPEP